MIIKTRKLAPTNTHDARIRATAQGATAELTIAYPYEVVDPHLAVATLLNAAMGWGADVIRVSDRVNQYYTVESGK